MLLQYLEVEASRLLVPSQATLPGMDTLISRMASLRSLATSSNAETTQFWAVRARYLAFAFACTSTFPPICVTKYGPPS